MEELIDLATKYINEHPVEAASDLNSLQLDDLLPFLASQSNADVAFILPYLSKHIGAKLLEYMDASQSSNLVNTLPVDFAASICRSMSRKAFDSMEGITDQ